MINVLVNDYANHPTLSFDDRLDETGQQLVGVGV